MTRKRNSLNAQKAKMDAQSEQIQALRTSAANLSAQIVTLRRNALKTQLALNSGSILGGRFWAPVVTPQAEDVRRLSAFQEQLSDAFTVAREPDWRYGSAFLIVIAMVMSSTGRRYLEKYLARAGIHWLPEGRLRRSF